MYTRGHSATTWTKFNSVLTPSSGQLWTFVARPSVDFLLTPPLNFSPILQKLLPTYPHRVENWAIAMAPLFLRLILIKHHTHFFTNNLAVHLVFVYIDFCWVNRHNSYLQQKRSDKGADWISLVGLLVLVKMK